MSTLTHLNTNIGINNAGGITNKKSTRKPLVATSSRSKDEQVEINRDINRQLYTSLSRITVVALSTERYRGYPKARLALLTAVVAQHQNHW